MGDRALEDKDHYCPKCQVTLLDIKCPRCGGPMLLVEKHATPESIRKKRIRMQKRREEFSSSLSEGYSLSTEYFRQRKFMHAHRDDS